MTGINVSIHCIHYNALWVDKWLSCLRSDVASSFSTSLHTYCRLLFIMSTEAEVFGHPKREIKNTSIGISILMIPATWTLARHKENSLALFRRPRPSLILSIFVK